jgi:hypothetical protein
LNHNNWQRDVKQEFGAPAREVIQSYAESGYSKLLTAGAIGITTQTLLRYARRNGIEFAERINLRPECKPKPQVKGIVRNPWGRAGNPDKIT